MKYKILAGSALGLALSLAALAAQAQVGPPPVPVTTDQCKHDGWRTFGDMFKNQGDCVSFVVTDGRNAPDGPPVH